MLEEAVALEPDNDRTLFTLGAAYDEAKNKPKAIELMQRAIALNPQNAAALNYLGYTYAELGERLDEAEQLIRRALAIEPDDGFYIDSLGWVYYQRGDYGRAVEHLERAIELAGDDPTVTEHLGDAYEKIGKTRDAIRVYQEALGKAKEPEQIDRLKGKLDALGAGTRTSATESYSQRRALCVLVAACVLVGRLSAGEASTAAAVPTCRPRTRLLAGARRSAATAIRSRAGLRADRLRERRGERRRAPRGARRAAGPFSPRGALAVRGARRGRERRRVSWWSTRAARPRSIAVPRRAESVARLHAGAGRGRATSSAILLGSPPERARDRAGDRRARRRRRRRSS